jgi:pyruvate/2-oxoglutarate/acetoin dehydrogenase E1 component
METVLASCARTRRVLVVQEACRTAGLGAELAAQIGEELFGSLDAPVRRLATPDVVLPANTALERALVPDATATGEAIRSLVRS